MACGARAAPGRPPLRLTPSSWGKPIMTARPAVMAAGSPRQNSMTSSRRTSSGRRGPSSGPTGSSRVDHPTTLDDAPDMIDPEVVKQLPIVGNVEYHEIRLLARLDGADAICQADGRGGIDRESGHSLRRQHFHLGASNGADQWQIFRGRGAGITV